MSDVLLEQDDDGGDIEFVGGVLTMTDGLETAAYLSLFGGNEDDSGSPSDKSKQWWGNVGEKVPARQYRSETAYLLRSIPSIPANLRRIEAAAARDLAWMEEELGATVVAQARIPSLNRVSLTITGQMGSTPYTLAFAETWGTKT